MLKFLSKDIYLAYAERLIWDREQTVRSQMSEMT